MKSYKETKAAVKSLILKKRGIYNIRDYLGIGQRQAYELVKSEGFPAKKLGNSYRIPKDDFLDWVKKQ